MSTFPKSPKEITGGMMYFARMIDKIRLHAGGKLGPDYHKNLGGNAPVTGCAATFSASTTPH